MTDDIASRLRQIPGFPEERVKLLVERIETVLSYEAKVGIFGKTGAGKSSLCNALFGQEVSEVSDVRACTRDPKEVLLKVGNGGIKLLDCPGVGESLERDQEYEDLYASLLPELDLILWLIKADDRAVAVDERFFLTVVRPHMEAGKPLFIVLSQADKIEPVREWYETKSPPGPRQHANLQAKRNEVAASFDVNIDRVMPVSSNESYNIVSLVDQIIFALPKEKKISVAKQVKSENRSAEARAEAERGFFEAIGEEVGKALGGEGGKNAGKMVGAFLDTFIAPWLSKWWS
ncbi:GTPase family protein [Vulcanococcus limneticus]|uniref:GTPase family protein n=1 Tax=Vulcanococcus limneticus TaxID=2170428 RepID=UPI00398BE9BE